MEYLFAVKEFCGDKIPQIEKVPIVKTTKHSVYTEGHAEGLGYKRRISLDEANEKYSSPHKAWIIYINSLKNQRNRLVEQLAKVDKHLESV